jgi:hypothetical protein
MTFIDSLIQSLDARIAEANEEIAQLEAARTALIGKSNGRARTQPEPKVEKPAPKKPARPRAGRKPRQKREVVPAEKLVVLLGERGDQSTAELAKLADGTPDQVLALLKELETADKIRRTGQRRSTRWRLMTEDDRVADRVAELEAPRR